MFDVRDLAFCWPSIGRKTMPQFFRGAKNPRNLVLSIRRFAIVPDYEIQRLPKI